MIGTRGRTIWGGRADEEKDGGMFPALLRDVPIEAIASDALLPCAAFTAVLAKRAAVFGCFVLVSSLVRDYSVYLVYLLFVRSRWC